MSRSIYDNVKCCNEICSVVGGCGIDDFSVGSVECKICGNTITIETYHDYDTDHELTYSISIERGNK